MIVFENVRLIDPVAGEVREGSLSVAGGRIVSGRPRLAEVIDGGGKCLAPGIVDVGVKVGEPGERHKEGFGTAGRAAVAGGVTRIITRPDTDPAIDTPETLSYQRAQAAERCICQVTPMAALTAGRAGRQMAEIGFLRDAGAAAFTDCDVVTPTRVAARCWRYAASLGALVMSHPQDPHLSEGASATSGAFASLRGIPAVAPIAERMGLERDLALAEMTGVRLHADQITTAAALPALERAKAAGLDVTAGTSIHHVTLNALDVADWRTFFKVKPPLRDEEDRRAIAEALGSGLIDVLCSMHTPQDEESKRLPYEVAASGAVALETLLPAAMRLVHDGTLDLPQLWRALSLRPARRFGVEGGTLDEGAPADLVLFDPDAPFVLNRETLRSKSKNTPFDGARMEGRVIGTWIGGRRVFG